MIAHQSSHPSEPLPPDILHAIFKGTIIMQSAYVDIEEPSRVRRTLSASFDEFIAWEMRGRLCEVKDRSAVRIHSSTAQKASKKSAGGSGRCFSLDLALYIVKYYIMRPMLENHPLCRSCQRASLIFFTAFEPWLSYKTSLLRRSTCPAAPV